MFVLGVVLIGLGVVAWYVLTPPGPEFDFGARKIVVLQIDDWGMEG